MYVSQYLVKKHFKETEKLIRNVKNTDIAKWLLSKGYFPETNILPPTFVSKELQLKSQPYNKNLKSLTRRQLISISYPKTMLTSRVFSIQHPWNYHDIVYYLCEDWEKILDILFCQDLKIFSYSLPLPVSKDRDGELTELRAGRMIYEWIRMAESDLVQDSRFFKLIIKSDITNFYSSIYTHSIAWAIEGKEKAFKDKEFKLTGSKIDKLIQYANDAKTDGIPVGSALSDLIAEILLSYVDAKVSKSLSNLNFVAVRFKDDYRILCESEEDGKTILRQLSLELASVNLALNETKTNISALPDGLYRAHDRQYFPHSLREDKKISFKTFEHTLLIALDIHRENPGTSILEKFFSELLDNRKRLKLIFSNQNAIKLHQIRKLFSLLFLVKRESEKILSNILSIIETIYVDNLQYNDQLKPFLKEIVIAEIKLASEKNSAFEVSWFIFFSRYLGLGIVGFKELINNKKIEENSYIKCLLTSQNHLFKETKTNLFRKPSDCKHQKLSEHLDIFKRG